MANYDSFSDDHIVNKWPLIHLQPFLLDSETPFGQVAAWLLGVGSAGRAGEDRARECREQWWWVDQGLVSEV